MSRSFRIVFLSSFALLFLFVAVFLTTGDSVDANPPSYWVTVDESEFEHIAAAGLKQGFEIVERRGGLAIVKLDENQILDLTGKMHEEFHKCSGFIWHETFEDASRSIDKSFAADLNAAFVNYTINNDANVTPMLAEAQEPYIRQTIIDLSSLHTRRHDQEGGLDGANMILNKWNALKAGRTDITVGAYAHISATTGEFITPQPSIVMTIQGTEFPDEIVVVGGHQDSILSGSTTGNAPGADDDASGIASMTEVIRVIKETGFKPKRTLQFMAYAAEEVGLRGSKNIAENYRAQNKNVIGVMQLDMTNFTNFTSPWADIVLITDHTNAAQNQFLRDLNTHYLQYVMENDQCGYGCSDHKSWTDNQYPASMPFEAKFSNTGTPRQYNTALHTTNDTIARSNGNANHALKFTKLALTFVGELAKGEVAAPPVAPSTTAFDFDGDGRADISVFRPSDGVWHLNRSQAGYTAMGFGLPTDRMAPADYDGDGKTDVAIYRNGEWHLLRSSLGYSALQWGVTGDIPQPGDYDGDGKADIAVFRPSNGVWYIYLSSDSSYRIFQFGLSGDLPVAADYDGDGKTDAAIYRNGEWHILQSTDGYTTYPFGSASDKPIVGDFDGDGKADATVYRDGVWYTLRSTGGFTAQQWGIAGDIPTAADYDGDGRADLAVYREGIWYIYRSSDSGFTIEQFGIATDKPAPAAFNP